MHKEKMIRDYFKKGFTYDEILALLDKYHGIRMSIATLKRRIEYGLKRRNVRHDWSKFSSKQDQKSVRSGLDGPDCMGGYRHIWHALKKQGISVPHSVFRNFCRDVHKLL